jgi:hypothetical protein
MDAEQLIERLGKIEASFQNISLLFSKDELHFLLKQHGVFLKQLSKEAYVAAFLELINKKSIRVPKSNEIFKFTPANGPHVFPHTDVKKAIESPDLRHQYFQYDACQELIQNSIDLSDNFDEDLSQEGSLMSHGETDEITPSHSPSLTLGDAPPLISMQTSLLPSHVLKQDFKDGVDLDGYYISSDEVDSVNFSSSSSQSSIIEDDRNELCDSKQKKSDQPRSNEAAVVVLASTHESNIKSEKKRPRIGAAVSRRRHITRRDSGAAALTPQERMQLARLLSLVGYDGIEKVPGSFVDIVRAGNTEIRIQKLTRDAEVQTDNECQGTTRSWSDFSSRVTTDKDTVEEAQQTNPLTKDTRQLTIMERLAQMINTDDERDEEDVGYPPSLSTATVDDCNDDSFRRPMNQNGVKSIEELASKLWNP